MTRPSAWQQRKTALRLTAITRSHSSSVMVLGVVPSADAGIVDADIEMAPSRADRIDHGVDLRLLSPRRRSVPSSARRVSSALWLTAVAVSGLISTIATSAPASARAVANARPIPWPPPVTSAVRPWRRESVEYAHCALLSKRVAQPRPAGLPGWMLFTRGSGPRYRGCRA